MKLIVNKALLGEAANLLARVINPKNALPILCDVLFDVKNNEVTLTASDSEVTTMVARTMAAIRAGSWRDNRRDV